jgi:protein-export membrane protein SecD
MTKSRVWLILISILVLAVLAGNLVYPKYFDEAGDFLNWKYHLRLPHFWNKPFKLGLDLQGGSHLIYQADLSQIDQADKANAMTGLRDVIERRINYFGVAEPVVQVQGERLVVELAGIIDPAQAIAEIGKTPFLEFKEPKADDIVKAIQDKQKEVQGKSMEELQKIPDWQLAFEDPYQSTGLTGKYLQKAVLIYDQTTYKPQVSLEFNAEGAKLFEDLTSRNVGKPIAIYIDQSVISAPVVQEKISGGKAQITGSFTVEQARELVRNLNAGALPVPIKLISQQNVGPTLGKISLEQSLKAGILGFLGVILFMIIFYRLPGVLASLALIIYIILVLALFKLVPVTLTLAGIAGFLLSIGMAVDANILIFSRMREELRQQKNFTNSVEDGFRRAWPSIRDSNFNSLIVCAILFSFATSFIKGFALTLAIGILASLFSAIFITRMLLRIFIGTKLEKYKWLW